MTDMLETGVTWLNEMRDTHFVKSVTYRRGRSSVTINATRGRTQTNIVGEDAVEVAGQIDDWIVMASDLVLDGERIWPEIGDQIREVSGSETFVYDVRKGPDGEGWRYQDAFKQTLRIHTLRAAIE